MKITSKMRKRALSSIIEYLTSVEDATRSEIFENAISLCGLRCEQLYDTSPKSKYSILKSYLGTALNDLINKKHVLRDGERYKLAREEFIIVKEDMAHDEIKSYLSTGLYTKEDIFTHLEQFFGTDATLSTRDDYSLRSIAGNILFELTQNGEIEIIDGKYTYSKELEKHTKLDTPLPEKEFKPKFFKGLWLRGGSFFESFVANLLEKFFSLSGKMVVYCDVSGGSDDGGIDVVLEIVDYLGFVEKIKVQTKNRDKAQVNEKEVREFYGAMNAQRGTRGIYVTTTYFHPSAQDLIDSLDDLVGIDGDKLWDLIKRTQYGIVKSKDGYSFDTEIFN
ncbi:MAG: restriction endonuclease [Clostridia bacterium]|nr:restriction endonuclease [Clostridia bacterium]